MSTLTFKDHFREVSRGRPGERFQDYYHRSKKDRKSGAARDRMVRIGLAVVAFAIGVVLVFIPGPAILFFFIGGGLLASESLFIARGMDWLEVHLRAAWRWGKTRWDRWPLGAKIAVGLVVAILGAGALWGSWKLLAG